MRSMANRRKFRRSKKRPSNQFPDPAGIVPCPFRSFFLAYFCAPSLRPILTSAPPIQFFSLFSPLHIRLSFSNSSAHLPISFHRPAGHKSNPPCSRWKIRGPVPHGIVLLVVPGAFPQVADMPFRPSDGKSFQPLIEKKKAKTDLQKPAPHTTPQPPFFFFSSPANANRQFFCLNETIAQRAPRTRIGWLYPGGPPKANGNDLAPP